MSLWVLCVYSGLVLFCWLHILLTLMTWWIRRGWELQWTISLCYPDKKRNNWNFWPFQSWNQIASALLWSTYARSDFPSILADVLFQIYQQVISQSNYCISDNWRCTTPHILLHFLRGSLQREHCSADKTHTALYFLAKGLLEQRSIV